MLARYQIVRGKRPPGDPLPEGHRIDTRKHRKHVLSPDPRAVERLLADVNERTFARFAKDYQALLEARFADDRAPFDALADEAREHPVYLGCNCPTHKNPDVNHCHTVLALRFMKRKYPKLKIVLPEPS